MNFRRGFQRVYAVLTVAWVGVMLFVIPSHRLRFWTPDTDYDALLPPPPPGYTIISSPDSPKITGAGRVEKSVWLFEVMALPPIAGYLLIFLVAPWIYRGFQGTS
jgi:hypothetical protein